MVQIWWGWRLAFDATAIYVVLHYFALYPTIFWRHTKSEPIRYNQRRRQYFNNPYFSDAATWKNVYDKHFNLHHQF